MSKQIRNLGVFLALCYAALFLQVNRLTMFEADELQEKPGNNRAVERDFSAPRGTIETADGVVVAESVPSNDRFVFQRRYPTGDLFAAVTGFYAFELGSAGVEKEYNDELAGRTIDFDLREVGDLFVDRERVGNLTLSLRNDVQSIAREQLGDRAGSVVALDPRTGEIIALWSTPSYDPNLISTHDLPAAKANATALNADPAHPTRARTYQEREFPGSTFKIVTATAGIEEGGVTEDQPDFPVSDGYVAAGQGRPIGNFGGASCGGKLFTVLQDSCNTAFAQMGVENARAAGLTDIAQAFGFNQDVPLDLPGAVQSVFPAEVVANDPPALAQASIGQNSVQATPLQMAMVAGAVANGGEIMTPHVMREVRDDQGEKVDEYDQEVWTQAMSPGTAETLRRGMISVVTEGTASRLGVGLEDFEVGGKTGTAQLTGDGSSSHAWIIGFAGPPGEAPQVAVAVLVEAQEGASEQTGGRVAAPIAAAVMQAALSQPTGAGQTDGASQGG
ncbi:MAG TPA: penicillin-binding transpeptidase domain-containing protein [Acidimicrobiales bacterium]|nr:penicillin-binding transpeptidase domain-containing protein [Acidimicrobiales bacterium]